MADLGTLSEKLSTDMFTLKEIQKKISEKEAKLKLHEERIQREKEALLAEAEKITKHWERTMWQLHQRDGIKALESTHGKVYLKAVPAQLELVDEKRLAKWAEKHIFIETKKKVMWGALKDWSRRKKVVPPGTKIIPAKMKFYCKVR